jgi:hypothetical protein
MKTIAPFLLLPLVVLAQVNLKNGPTRLGPVRDLVCASDGGLSCARDGGASAGILTCSPASTVETGCITPNAQSIAGDKTFLGFLRMTGKAHASLTACDVAHQNMLQGCTTHGALVWCDGTDNQELLGGASDESVLAAEYVNGVPAGFVGWIQLPSNAGWTLNAISGAWTAGVGSGTLRLSFFGTAGTCNCDVSCSTPSSRTSCSGTCSWSAGDQLFFFRGSSGSPCTYDPHISGNLYMMGVAQ